MIRKKENPQTDRQTDREFNFRCHSNAMDRRVQWPNKMKNQTNKGLYLPEVHRKQTQYTVERVSLSTRQTDTLK